MPDSLLPFLPFLPLIVGLALALWHPERRPEMLTGIGLIGLSLAGVFDLTDNCSLDMCDEHDPALLTASWLISGTVVASGVAGILARAIKRRDARPRDVGPADRAGKRSRS
jgi:hypothetical protein